MDSERFINLDGLRLAFDSEIGELDGEMYASEPIRTEDPAHPLITIWAVVSKHGYHWVDGRLRGARILSCWSEDHASGEFLEQCDDEISQSDFEGFVCEVARLHGMRI